MINMKEKHIKNKSVKTYLIMDRFFFYINFYEEKKKCKKVALILM